MIKIVCVGKVKEKFIRDAIDEYTKRLSKYTKLEIIEVMDVSGDNINTILSKEKDLILKHINTRDFIVTLEIEGKSVSSPEFAKIIDNVLMDTSTITFVIGGSHGLHQDIKDRSNLRLSFSKLTFPHQLFRVILLEQIYRSFKILNNETYHK